MTVKEDLSDADKVYKYFKKHFGVESTWEAWGTDRVPRGTTSKANQEVGSDTVTLSSTNLPSHSHTLNFTKSDNPINAFTVDFSTNDNTASHTHTVRMDEINDPDSEEDGNGRHYHQMKGWVPNKESNNSWKNAKTLGSGESESGGCWASAHDGSADNTFRSAHHHYTCHGWAIPWTRLWTKKDGAHTHTITSTELTHNHSVSLPITTETLASGMNSLGYSVSGPNTTEGASAINIIPKAITCFMYRRIS
jgi:hypothetical protein